MDNKKQLQPFPTRTSQGFLNHILENGYVAEGVQLKNKGQYWRYFTFRYVAKIDTKEEFFDYLKKSGADNFDIVSTISKINKHKIKNFFRTMLTYIVIEIRKIGNKMENNDTITEFIPISLCITFLVLLVGIGMFAAVGGWFDTNDAMFMLENHVLNVWANIAGVIGSLVVLVFIVIATVALGMGIVYGITKGWKKLKEIA